jgi:hypothetical protein
LLQWKNILQPAAICGLQSAEERFAERCPPMTWLLRSVIARHIY